MNATKNFLENKQKSLKEAGKRVEGIFKDFTCLATELEIENTKIANDIEDIDLYVDALKSTKTELQNAKAYNDGMVTKIRDFLTVK